MQPQLTRSRTDRMVAGVCGGLGHYFGVDPVIVRLIFVVLALTTFTTPVIYPVLWLIMPEQSTLHGAGTPIGLPPDARFDPMTGEPLPPPAEPRAGAMGGRNRVLGLLLAGFGAIVLLDQVGSALSRLFNFDVGSLVIPLLLVGLGIFLLRKQSV